MNIQAIAIVQYYSTDKQIFVYATNKKSTIKQTGRIV